MNREERIKVHQVSIDPMYLPDPIKHLYNPRDRKHFEIARQTMTEFHAKTGLDVGCYDGWLDFLLIGQGFKMTGVELIEPLAEAAERYASKNCSSFEVYQGFFEDIEFDQKFDVGICFEMLEHVELDVAKAYVEKLYGLCEKAILISLPDQKHEDNPQHLWTPSESTIDYLLKDRRDFRSFRKNYSNGVPSNWFIILEI